MPGVFASIRLEDIEPGGPYRNYGSLNEAEPLQKLKTIIDYLYSKNIPFSVNLIPEYIDPIHPEQNISIIDVTSPYMQEFLDILQYMKDRGGDIGIHGFSHQYGNLASGNGFEFHTSSLPANDPNNPPDSLDYDNSRLQGAVSIMQQAGIEIGYWSEPHYSGISPFFQQENVFPKYISVLKQYDVLDSFVPSELQRKIEYHDVNYEVGRGVIYHNAPLLYISPTAIPNHNNILSVPYILYNAQQYTDDEQATFFYHPYLEFDFMIKDNQGNWVYDPEKTSYLHQLLETGAYDDSGYYPGLIAQGYIFTILPQLIPFYPAQRLQTTLSSGMRVLSGDFNGDGKADVVVWNMSNGDWTVYLSNITGPIPRYGTSNQFLLSGTWLKTWAISGLWIPLVGDVNGDGKDDLIVYNFTLGQWQVALSDGTKFIPQGIWINNWGVRTSQNNWQAMVGDFNGDGKIDILTADTTSVQVAFSNGSAFIPQGTWLNDRRRGVVYTGNFHGNGKYDIAIWDSMNGDWYVALNSGSSFVMENVPWITGFGVSEGTWSPFVADFNGDGKSDILLYAPATGTWEVSLSTGTAFERYFVMSSGPWGVSNYYWITVGDFDGNIKQDIGLLDIPNGTFDIAISSVVQRPTTMQEIILKSMT